MLDDLKYIHTKDSADALGIAGKIAQQLRHEFDIPKLSKDITAVVYAGMGGSALAALLSQTWPGYSVPFEIVRNYELPEYVDEKTLVMVCSYSGNTEESLSALDQAKEKHAQIITIASGGALVEKSREYAVPCVLLPVAAQPRYAAPYNFKAIIDILIAAGIIEADPTHALLHKAADFLEASVQHWAPTVPTASNPAKQLALELIGKSVVVYAGPKMFPAAYKWKISINENAKQIAWCNQFPELNHNELLGWTEQPIEKPYAVVDLLSSFEHPRVQKRMQVMERILSGRKPAAHMIELAGESMLDQLLWATSFGDFVSLYMGLLNGLDPAPVVLIEKFKKALNE